MRALLEHIADDEVFARLAFFELPTAGPVALDRADEVFDEFTSYLAPGAAAPTDADGPLPRSVLEAIPSGVWAVIQHEIAHGRREELAAVAPEVARIVLTPLDRL